MKLKIVMFVLPQEIDYYAEVVKQLKLNSFDLDLDQDVEI